jgi:hypothetical protein
VQVPLARWLELEERLASAKRAHEWLVWSGDEGDMQRVWATLTTAMEGMPKGALHEARGMLQGLTGEIDG